MGAGSLTQVRQMGGGSVAPVRGGTEVTLYKCCWPGLPSGIPKKYLKRKRKVEKMLNLERYIEFTFLILNQTNAFKSL